MARKVTPVTPRKKACYEISERDQRSNAGNAGNAKTYTLCERHNLSSLCVYFSVTTVTLLLIYILDIYNKGLRGFVAVTLTVTPFREALPLGFDIAAATSNPQPPARVTRYHIVTPALGEAASAFRRFPGVVIPETHQNRLAPCQTRRTGMVRGLG